VTPTILLQLFLNGLILGGVYALTALGISMVYGLLRIIHVAHAGIFVLGAYTGLLVFLFTGNFPLAISAAALISMAAGLIFPKLYFTMLGASPLVPLIASIGLFIFLEDLYRLIAGPYILTFPGTVWRYTYNIGGIFVTAIQIAMVVVTSVLFALVAVIFKTRVGLAWRAAQQDFNMALAFGVNPNIIIALNFMLGSALAGVAGILVGAYYNAVFPTMGAEPAYKSLAIPVLGGFGSVVGTITAALIIGMAETLVGGLIGYILPRDAIAFIVLIIILILRPWGLFGRKESL
jgi:branched-chain amino acid transport system permease protein